MAASVEQSTPRSLTKIEADTKTLESEIVAMLGEVV